MKRIIVYIILLIFLSGCTPKATPEPTATSEPTATPTKINYDAEKALIATSLMAKFNAVGTNINCESVTWVGDLIKAKCGLVDWFDEPNDHGFLHYQMLDTLIDILKGSDAEKYLSDNMMIEFITIGRMKPIQMLSKTIFSTFSKIMDGTITTQVEWKSEAEITTN